MKFADQTVTSIWPNKVNYLIKNIEYCVSAKKHRSFEMWDKYNLLRLKSTIILFTIFSQGKKIWFFHSSTLFDHWAKFYGSVSLKIYFLFYNYRQRNQILYNFMRTNSDFIPVLFLFSFFIAKAKKKKKIRIRKSKKATEQTTRMIEIVWDSKILVEVKRVNMC